MIDPNRKDDDSENSSENSSDEEGSQANEFTFISEKHRIIFVRRGITDRSSRQHLHKIIKQNQ